MKRVEYANLFNGPAREIKLAESDPEFKSWVETVVQSIPAPTDHEIPGQCNIPFTMYFYGMNLPKPRSGFFVAPLRSPCNPKFLYLLEVDNLSSITEPVISLMRQTGPLYRFHLDHFLDAEKSLFINCSSESNTIRFCIAHIDNAGYCWNRIQLIEGERVPYIIVDFVLLVILPDRLEVLPSEIHKVVNELNRAGLNITNCYTTIDGGQ